METDRKIWKKYSDHKQYLTGKSVQILPNSYFNSKLAVYKNINVSVLNHDHEKDDVNILTRQKVSNKLKRKALEDPFEKPCKILH
ncbi:hypothetical protein QTP88_011980 [Uroleucon formosanum]